VGECRISRRHWRCFWSTNQKKKGVNWGGEGARTFCQDVAIGSKEDQKNNKEEEGKEDPMRTGKRPTGSRKENRRKEDMEKKVGAEGPTDMLKKWRGGFTQKGRPKKINHNEEWGQEREEKTMGQKPVHSETETATKD